MAKKNRKGIIAIVILISVVVTGAIVKTIVFTVDETKYTVITQFGMPVREILSPGLYFKLPDPIQNLWEIDKRIKISSPPVSELLTKDKKNIMIESYIAWMVKGPLAFKKSLNNIPYALDRLNEIVFSQISIFLGKYNLDELINIERDKIKVNELVSLVKGSSNDKLSSYGIELVDVQLKQIGFPDTNKQSVFQRMKAEREKMARLYRSEGTEESSKIRAEADKEVATIKSKAREEAEKIKGKGDAEAIRIYADAFKRDPKFYEFTRSLEAYEKLIDEKSTLILPSNSKLLQYLNSVE